MSKESASMKANTRSSRNSSIELLRIISMLMIALCHFATHGGFAFDAQTLSVPRFWWNVIEMGGNFGNNVFILISGYFLINDKGNIFNFKGILRFWGQIFFYSISIYCIFCVAGISEFGIISLIKSIFPITFKSWWFASTYFVLYVLHPFINILLYNLDKSEFQKLLIMLITFWCLIPTFMVSDFQSNNLLWFITLYCVAGYVRLYGLSPKFTIKHWVLIWLLFSLLRYLSCVVLILLGTKIPLAYTHTLFFYKDQSVFTFVSALALFMVFKKMNIGTHKWINVMASATFGVYLIHDNNYVRPFLWLTVFKNFQYQDSPMLIPYSIAVAFLVYAVCTLIDLLRQQTIEKAYISIVNVYADSWLKPFARVHEALKQTVFGK